MTRTTFQNLAIAAIATLGLGAAATAQAADPGEKVYSQQRLTPQSIVIDTNVQIAAGDSDAKTPHTTGAVAQARVTDGLGTQIVTLPEAKGGGR
jgi:hypothetical protein